MRGGNKYASNLKEEALKRFALASLDVEANNLSVRCKFNLSYFTVGKPGYDFAELTKEQLLSVVESLREFSRNSLDYWANQGNRFIMYNKFPSNTDFKHPSHVPHQACWGRFRLGNKFRIVGFRIPSEYDRKCHDKLHYMFDRNTFYIVFLDLDHRFWKTEPK